MASYTKIEFVIGGTIMAKMIDKVFLFAFGTLLLTGTESFLVPVLVSLTALIYICLSLYFTKIKEFAVMMAVFVGVCFYWNELSVFLPALCYDCIWFSMWWGLGITAVGILPLAWMCQTGTMEPWHLAIWLFCIPVAVISAVRTKKQEQMKEEFIHLRDNSTELKLVMQKRQRELLEKQDYEIHLATLQERNRIAREIHDNVGHMLSRSILQVGALLTIHKEEPLHEQLTNVNTTLNDAMNSIRESVHDLHNESLDLRQAVLEATNELKDRCRIRLDYDMPEHVKRNVKYCLISIVKEAMANIAKHSNADRITLILREHPGFYQMSIEDNGTDIRISENPGIGLSNMTDRVEALGGTIHFFTEHGFRILVSIPKQRMQNV